MNVGHAQAKLEHDYKDRWCGYGGHFVMNLSPEGFIAHIHDCEKKLCDNYKKIKTPPKNQYYD